MLQAFPENSEGSGAGRKKTLADRSRTASRKRAVIEAMAVFCLFALFVCACTWPLVTGPSQNLPPHWDPRLNAWNMASSCQRILTSPSLLFHGNNFYPYGSTKAFSEILLIPSLFSMPVLLLWGNPVLSYNITLLVLWSLSGLTMYLCVREMVGHRWGALLGATIWTLAPFRTDYYLEFQMQMCFAVPLVILFWYRFLCTQRPKQAALACLFLGIQALSSWSWAILVSLYLVVFSIAYVLLKQRGWKIKKLLKAVPIVIVFCVAMFPFASPYFRVRSELGIERRLNESVPHSADILTYVESGPIRMYHFSPTHHHAEASLFPGFVALFFLVLSCGYFFRRQAQSKRRKGSRILVLAAAGGLLFALLHLALRAAGVSGMVEFVHAMRFSTASAWAVGFSLLLLLLRGWRQGKIRVREGIFSEKDILVTFLFTCFVMFLLSLGPVVHVKRQAIGHGPYYHLYSTIFPLHAMRIVSRFGGLVLFSVAILSALGLKWLHSTVRQRWKLVGALACVPFLLASLEYFPWRLTYEKFHWEQRPPVYEFVASDPADFAIAEWPLGWRYEDGECLLWSIAHDKKVLGGVSRWRGRMPPRTRELSKTLSEVPDPAHTAASMSELRAIYPLKYLIVHKRSLPEEMWKPWEGLLQNLPEGLTLLHVYDNHDYLFAIRPVVERGHEFRREFSFEYLLRHNVARFRLRAGSPTDDSRAVKICFNEGEVCQDVLKLDWKEYKLKLTKPCRKVAPNCIRIVALGRDHEESDIEFEGFSLSPR